MKQLTAITLLVILSFASCKKEEQKFCWKCTFMPTNATGTGVSSINKTVTDVCNKTEAEIRAYETDNTKTKTPNGSTVTIQSMKCSQSQ